MVEKRKTKNAKLNLADHHISCRVCKTAKKRLANFGGIGLLTLIVCMGLVGCAGLSSDATISNSDNYVETKLGNTHTNSKVALIRTQMAAQYLINNQLDDAKLELEKAFAADNRYAPAYDMMGLLLQQEGSQINVAKAEAFFLQAIEFDPEFMQARNNYGVYLSQLQRYPQAIEQFQIAGAALGYKGRIGALENLGLTALKVNDTQLATQAFIRVLESERHNLTAHVELIDILLRSGNIAQAQNLYDETVIILGEQLTDYPRVMAQGAELNRLQQ